MNTGPFTPATFLSFLVQLQHLDSFPKIISKDPPLPLTPVGLFPCRFFQPSLNLLGKVHSANPSGNPWGQVLAPHNKLTVVRLSAEQK